MRLGDPLLVPCIVAQASTSEDVNGDGLLDVVFDFGPARAFGAAGALDGSSAEVKLTGLAAGVAVVGTDAITIFGGGT